MASFCNNCRLYLTSTANSDPRRAHTEQLNHTVNWYRVSQTVMSTAEVGAMTFPEH